MDTNDTAKINEAIRLLYEVLLKNEEAKRLKLLEYPFPYHLNLQYELARQKQAELDEIRKTVLHFDNSINEKEEPTFLKFTEKEILKMPKKVRKEFRVDGCTARITKRKSGKNGHCYEIRYRRNGYNVAVSSTNLETAKEKFILALKNAVKEEDKAPRLPKTFHDFTMYYFKNLRLGTVSKGTYTRDLQSYEKYIKPSFGSSLVESINAAQCKSLLDSILHSGLGRTYERVRTVLNQIFKMAIEHELIRRNPLLIIKFTRHEREGGKLISKDDEKKLLQALKGTNYHLPIALMLYAGLRPNEIYTARVEGAFIVANNSKRKDNRKEDKRIAISPMLAPHLPTSFSLSDFHKYDALYDKFKNILPNHTPKDCRTTFSTRAQECGVNRVVIRLFMGHSIADVLGKHYTDFSDEYLIDEAQKIKY